MKMLNKKKTENKNFVEKASQRRYQKESNKMT